MIKMLGGSFKGVPFFTDSIEKEGGRRTVVHEFPNSNEIYTQDLGAKRRAYKMSCYTHGALADYYSKRDALVTALESNGPGILIVPTVGSMNAVVDGAYTMSEDINKERGIARFSLKFVQIDTLKESAPPAGADPAVRESERALREQAKLIVLNGWPANLLAQKSEQVMEYFLDKYNGFLDSVSAEANKKTDYEGQRKVNEISVKKSPAEVSAIRAPIRTPDQQKAVSGYASRLLSVVGNSYAVMYGTGKDLKTTYSYLKDMYEDYYPLPILEERTEESYKDYRFELYMRELSMVTICSLCASCVSGMEFIDSEELLTYKAEVNSLIGRTSSDPHVAQVYTNPLMQLKHTLFKQLDSLLLTAKRTMKMSTLPVPLLKLVYSLYDADDNYPLLVAVNKLVDTSSVAGAIVSEVYTEQGNRKERREIQSAELTVFSY